MKLKLFCRPLLLLALLSANPASAATNAVLSRIVMIGASVTAGYTASEPLGGPLTGQVSLSRYLDAALKIPHDPVKNLGTPLFFLADPAVVGRQQLHEALKAKPTLVTGIDFLFWFCYGRVADEKQRLQRLEQGLKLLESIDCPVIIGDIPDASAAVGQALVEEQIPAVKTLAAANRRIKKWAAKRRQVVVLPVSELIRTIAANQAVTIHGQTLPKGGTRSLLQEDQLHPTPAGCAVLAISMLDAFSAVHPSLPAEDIRWNPKEVCHLGLARAEEAAPR